MLKKSITFLLTVVIFCALFTSAVAVSGSAAAKLKLKLKNVDKGVKLSWSKKANKTVKIQRKTKNGKFKTIKSISGKKSFTDKSVSAGKTYTYRLIYNGAASNKKKLTRLTTPVIGLIGNDDEGMRISWKKVKGAKKYEVYKTEITDNKTGKYTKIKTVKTNELAEYTESSGQPRKYKIRAVSGKSKSAFSKAKKYTHKENFFVSAAVSSGYNGITVSWDEVKGASEYYLYKAVGSEKSFLKIAEVTKARSLLYEDKDVEVGTNYSYYVIAKAGKTLIKSANISSIEYKDYIQKIDLKVGEVFKSPVPSDLEDISNITSTDEKVAAAKKLSGNAYEITAVGAGEAYVNIEYKAGGEYNAVYRYKIVVVDN